MFHEISAESIVLCVYVFAVFSLRRVCLKTRTKSLVISRYPVLHGIHYYTIVFAAAASVENQRKPSVGKLKNKTKPPTKTQKLTKAQTPKIWQLISLHTAIFGQIFVCVCVCVFVCVWVCGLCFLNFSAANLLLIFCIG